MKADKQAVLCCPYLWSCSEKNLELSQGDSVLVCIPRPERKCVTAPYYTRACNSKGTEILISTGIINQIWDPFATQWEVGSVICSAQTGSWVTRCSNSAMAHCCIFAALTNKYSSTNAKPKSWHQESPEKDWVTFCTKKLCYSKCTLLQVVFLNKLTGIEAFLPFSLAVPGYHIDLLPKASLKKVWFYPLSFPQTQKLK